MNNKMWSKDLNTEIQSDSLEHTSHSIRSQESTYHELSDSAVIKKDITELVRENLCLLEDLYARQRFLNREIRYLLKID